MTYNTTPTSTVRSLANRGVGVLVAQGVIGIIFGILVLSSPTRATAVLTPFIGYVIALWLIVSGAVQIASAVRSRAFFSGWGWDIFFGAVVLITGVVLLFVPVDTGFFFAMLVLWLIAFAVLFQALSVINLSNGWGAGIGILYLVLAIVMIWLLFSNPQESLEAIVWVAGLFGLLSGLVELLLAWQVNSARKAFSTARAGY